MLHSKGNNGAAGTENSQHGNYGPLRLVHAQANLHFWTYSALNQVAG
jgi:hypothetical protein